MSGHQRVVLERRRYNQWVADQTLEDFALRFTAAKARRWSAASVGNTALGAISFLACEAIGGTITLSFGFANAITAILAAGVLMFALAVPICVSATRHGVDIDLLTRGAGFGYIGSTITSLIYASFTFILFSIEASIMSAAIVMVLHVPPWLANVASALAVIPIAVYGIRAISRMQAWTQPVWLALQFGPLLCLALGNVHLVGDWTRFAGIDGNARFGLVPFGMAVSVLLSLLPQIGEQVDYLRFLPERRSTGKLAWWGSLLATGPGWVVIGCAKLAAGSFLAYLAISAGIAASQAAQPAILYRLAFDRVFDSPGLAAALTLVFVSICQIKINVTNAYAGSIAWSNFFSRLTHSHPGRAIWVVFNVLLALLLMQIGLYRVIGSILGIYANFAIGWIGALVADLLINKPLGLSPPGIEFKRAHLYDINPVGVGAMALSVLASTAMSFGVFGAVARALAPFGGLIVALVAAPAIAAATGGRTYLARRSDLPDSPSCESGPATLRCIVCENDFERPDMAFCPAYCGTICSLCCSLDARCHDLCKAGSEPPARLLDQFGRIFARLLPLRLAARIDRRVGHFLLVLSMITAAIGALLLLIGHEYGVLDPAARPVIRATLWVVFLVLFIGAGVASWLFVLAQESRRTAEAETRRQTAMLMDEIDAHRRTDAALQTAKEAAESANTAKSRYMVGVIHEIRAPLNAIFGYAQLLEGAGAVKPEDAARIIRRSAEHLSNLVDGLLDISKIETGSLQLHRDRIDLGEFLDQIADMFRLQAAAKGLAFIDDRPATLPKVVATDAKRLRQILLNLLANAIKYTQHGSVGLKLRFRSQVAEFEIEDTGCGIRAEDMQRIFDPFERGHLPEAQAVAGTGLGLTISKLLANVMGGDITVESAPGAGSRFRLRVLLSEVSADSVPAAETRRIAGYEGARRSILLVDNDPAHIDLMREILAPLGFVVEAEPDGLRGLARAEAGMPDLAILDVSMPGLSGWELAQSLRELQGGPTLPILMVSGNLHEAQGAAGTKTAHDAFLAKPIDIRALLETIGRLLDLRWIHDDASKPVETPRPPARRPTRLPAREHLADLLELGRIGYLRGIEDKLADILRGDPDLAEPVAALETLIREFQLGAFTALLERWLEADGQDV